MIAAAGNETKNNVSHDAQCSVFEPGKFRVSGETGFRDPDSECTNQHDLFLQACNNNIAWQRFLPNGVLALLPLSDQLSSIVWSTSTANVKRLISLPETEFIDAVNECFVCFDLCKYFTLIKLYYLNISFVNQWKQYDKSEIVSKVMGSLQSLFGNHSQSQRQLPPSIKSLYESSRAAFPLGFGHSSSYVSTGTALIGYV